MNIILLSDERIRLEPAGGPLSIESESHDLQYSPFHMVASGLATCVFSVLYAWASNAGLSADDLTVEVGWEFAEEPYRVGRYEITLQWPGLPESRRAAAERAAHLCPLHRTLEHPPRVETRVEIG